MRKPYCPTFAVSIRASENGALLNAAEGLEQAPHIVLALLFVQHAHKQLSVFWNRISKWLTVRNSQTPYIKIQSNQHGLLNAQSLFYSRPCWHWKSTKGPKATLSFTLKVFLNLLTYWIADRIFPEKKKQQQILYLTERVMTSQNAWANHLNFNPIFFKIIYILYCNSVDISYNQGIIISFIFKAWKCAKLMQMFFWN